MSVRQNMGYGLKIAKLPKSEIDAKVQDAAKLLQLEPLLERKPRQLSGGQRQRVAMGRAIVREPSVFLFDEPLSNLDAKLRVQMRLEIRELQEKLGITALYVTHDQVEAMTMADRMIVMNGGIAEQIGTPLDVYEKPQTLFAAQFIGSPAMNIFDAHIEGGQVKIRDLPIGPAQGRDGPVKLGIRPEHLVKTSDAALNASIQMSEPLGANTLLHGKLTGFDNIAITASLPGVHLLETKSFHIGFAVEPANIHLFDPETGRRLPV
jgi:sn-glycerol 3-phosphate transport system ATP-binding protein